MTRILSLFGSGVIIYENIYFLLSSEESLKTGRKCVRAEFNALLHPLCRPRAAAFTYLFIFFPCNSWCGKAMGKAGSKVLREASVDGIQAQVQAARWHTNKQRKHASANRLTRRSRAGRHVQMCLGTKQANKNTWNRCISEVSVRLFAASFCRNETAVVLSRCGRLCKRDQPQLRFHTFICTLTFFQIASSYLQSWEDITELWAQ